MPEGANQFKEQIEHPYDTLDQLIDQYIAVRKPSDVHSYKRLKDDCGDYWISPETLKTKFLGGSDAYGNPIIGYVTLLENEHARINYHVQLFLSQFLFPIYLIKVS